MKVCEQMKIGVTGGAGFIGSHLVEKLLEEKHEVFVIDDLSTGKKENINRQAKFHKISLVSPALNRILEKEKPEIIFHLAAQSNVRKSAEDVALDANINIVGTANLLNSCIRAEVEKIIYASSGGAVYGEPESLPVNEDHLLKPKSFYGLSKLVGEKYVELFNYLYGFNYTILRYSNVYGPRQDPYGEAGVISIFAELMARSKRPTIYGDGEQVRDFIYVQDVVDVNLITLERGKGIYNIGSGEGTSINKIFEKISSELNVALKPVFEEPKKTEVRKIYLNTYKAKSELGWEPKTSLNEGIAKTVEWIKRKL